MVAAALANGDCSQASACIDPPQPVSPVSWSCESGNQADACFRQALAAGGDKEGCALIDDVKANVADCFSTLECCADWPSWTASWSSDDGYASCDFGICAELDGKIRMVVKLAYTKEVFDADETLQTNYRRAWAAAVQRSSRGSQTSSLEQVDLNDVVIVGTAVAALDTQRRRLLTDAVDVTTQIRTTDAGAALALASDADLLTHLNAELDALGIANGTFTSAPALIEDSRLSGTSSLVSGVSIMMLTAVTALVSFKSAL
eukprot:3602773-Rhodomonas_salina.3